MQEISLSYSRLRDLLTCPRRFEFRYILKVPAWVSSHLYLGGSVHIALGENFKFKIDTGEDMTEEQVSDIYSDAFDRKEAFEDEEEPAEILWEEEPGMVKDVGWQLLKTYHRRVAPRILPVAVELPFEHEYEGLHFRGRIDLMNVEGTIIDWKTVKRNKSQKEIRRDIQPALYALGVNSPIDFRFDLMIKTKIPSLASWELAVPQGSLDWARDILIPKARQMIASGIFPPNPFGWHCSEEDCPYWKLCRPSF